MRSASLPTQQTSEKPGALRECYRAAIGRRSLTTRTETLWRSGPTAATSAWTAERSGNPRMFRTLMPSASHGMKVGRQGPREPLRDSGLHTNK